MKNRQKFLEYMTNLANLFEKQVPESLLELYWKVLEPYTDAECETAFDAVIAKSTFFPKPVDFKVELDGRLRDTALIQSDKVLQAIKRSGRTYSVMCEDPITAKVIKDSFGGWVKLCSMTNDEAQWFPKNFIERYLVYARTGEKYIGALPGAYQTSQMRYIGDPKVAEAVNKALPEGGNDITGEITQFIKRPEEVKNGE